MGRFELYSTLGRSESIESDQIVRGLMGFTDSPRIAAEWQAGGGDVLDTTTGQLR